MKINYKNVAYLCIILLIFSFSSFFTWAIDVHIPQDVIATSGMVAAAHPLAARAGIEILKNGGNAIDAAVATAFALSAVEPNASGVGGGGFMLIRLATSKKVIVLDYRERAPAASVKDMFISDQSRQEKWSQEGGKASAIPGTLMGLKKALDQFGTMSLEEVLEPTLNYLENGFEISNSLSNIIKDNYSKLIKWNNPNSVAYLSDGLPLEKGDLLIQKDLAKTYREIIDNGIEYFYGGNLGQKVVDVIKKAGGILTLQDLKDYKVHFYQPVEGDYRGYKIYSMPPPSSGGTHLIQILNVMENYNIANLNYFSPTHISILSEAMKFSFADRSKYMADPFFSPNIPVKEITSKEYAKYLANQIDIFNPKLEIPTDELNNFEHFSTTHLSVVDNMGNAVALTQTINYFFGSGLIVPGTGIVMNNEMDDFSIDPNSPNAPEPGKTPLSSMSPTIIEKDNEVFMVLGSPGATRIFTAIAQIISNVIDFGMSIDEAIEAPRLHTYSSDGKAMPIYIENRVSPRTLEILKLLGNKVELKDPYDSYFGGVHGIIINGGMICGGGDSRRGGVALGY